MNAALEVGEWSAAHPGRTLPPGKDPVPIVLETGWAPGPVWTGGKSRLAGNSVYMEGHPNSRDTAKCARGPPISMIFSIEGLD